MFLFLQGSSSDFAFHNKFQVQIVILKNNTAYISWHVCNTV